MCYEIKIFSVFHITGKTFKNYFLFFLHIIVGYTFYANFKQIC